MSNTGRSYEVFLFQLDDNRERPLLRDFSRKTGEIIVSENKFKKLQERVYHLKNQFSEHLLYKKEFVKDGNQYLVIAGDQRSVAKTLNQAHVDQDIRTPTYVEAIHNDLGSLIESVEKRYS